MDSKLVAKGIVQSDRYTDAAVAHLQHEINTLRADLYRDEKKNSKVKMIFHFAFITCGIAISALLIHFRVSEYVAVTAPNAPLFVLEIVDKIKML
jgi:hypothetical protein